MIVKLNNHILVYLLMMGVFSVDGVFHDVTWFEISASCGEDLSLACMHAF